MGAYKGVREIPPDTIFGLSATFTADPRPNKISLGVGVFRDEQLKVPVLKCVQKAEKRLAEEAQTKAYLPIDGDPDFIQRTAKLAFGPDCAQLKAGRIYGAQSLGGSGALRVIGEFLFRTLGKKEVYLPDPSWDNHHGIFSACELETPSYPYYDKEKRCLAFEQMTRALGKLKAGSVVLFHLCCHNPTGADPSREQWKEIAKVVKAAGLIALFDCAYQGFAHTMDEDAWPLRHFVAEEIESILCYSYSKNFSLYAERIGGLFILTESPEEVHRVGSQMRKEIRENYSNPPCHGARIVSAVLGDPELDALWHEEIRAMRKRIHDMRDGLIEGLRDKGDFAFLTGQQGLFSFCGLGPEQTEVLRDKYALYMPPNGRINVTGLSRENLDYVIGAIADVL